MLPTVTGDLSHGSLDASGLRGETPANDPSLVVSPESEVRDHLKSDSSVGAVPVLPPELQGLVCLHCMER